MRVSFPLLSERDRNFTRIAAPSRTSPKPVSRTSREKMTKPSLSAPSLLCAEPLFLPRRTLSSAAALGAPLSSSLHPLFGCSVPHGVGKYLWMDDYMYEGEWAGGEITGRGKFSWSSGATYEGDFRSGFMYGVGTYTGPARDTYSGRWEMNRKHGEGRKEYANGDCYEGEWRWGAQDRRGKYVWKNGNEYDGEWKKGRISGKGLMVWANGNRYEGFWEDGLPKGEGKFEWSNGSFYVGNWSKDEQSATCYPSAAKSSVGYSDWNRSEVFSMDLAGDFSVCPAGEKVSVLPWQKMLNYGRQMQGKKKKGGGRKEWGLGQRGLDRICVWQTNGDITCDIVVGSSVVEREGKAGFIDLHVGAGESAPPSWKEIKKQGETISKGHKHYELMLGLQLGIR